MKKFLLLLVIFLFSITNANAVSTYVRYNNAGTPLSVTRGYGKPMTMSEASQRYGYTRYARPAHPSVPSRPAMPYGYRTRHAHMPPPLTNYNFLAPVQSATIPTQSRLDRNYNVSLPQKSYTMNGVTYYN